MSPRTEPCPRTDPSPEPCPSADPCPSTEPSAASCPSTEPSTTPPVILLSTEPSLPPSPAPPSSGTTLRHGSCDTIPPRYYEDPKRLLMAIRKLKFSKKYLQSIQSTWPWLVSTGPVVEDTEVASNLLQVSASVHNTVQELVRNPLATVEGMDVKVLEVEVRDFAIGIAFGSAAGFVFPEELIRILSKLKHLVPVGLKMVEVSLACLEAKWQQFLYSYSLDGTFYVGTSPSASSKPPYGTDTPTTSTERRSYILPNITRPGPAHVQNITTSAEPTYIPATSQQPGPILGDNTTATGTGYALTEGTATEPDSTEVLVDTRDLSPSTVEPRLRGNVTTGSWVEGRVCGYNLEDLLQSSFVIGSSRRQLHYIVTNMANIRNIIFKSVVRVWEVQGLSVWRVEKQGVALNASIVPSLTFARSVKVSGDVKAKVINGVPSTSYLTLHGTHRLPRPLTFTSVAVVGRVRVLEEVNDLDLVVWSGSVVVTTSAASLLCVSDVSFSHVVALSVVSETVRVAGTSLQDLVLLNETAVITGKKWFLEEVVVREGEVRTGALTVHRVSNISLATLFLHSLRKNSGGVQVVSGSHVLDQLVVKHDLVTRGLSSLSDRGHLSFLNLTKTAGRVVLLDQTATITGGLLLRGSVSLSFLTFLDTFDKVPAARYRDGWLLKSSNQTISGQMTLASMTSGHVMTSDGVEVQGVNLAHFKNITAMVDVSTLLTSPLTFTELVSMRWVSVSGRVQGWDLSEETIVSGSSVKTLVSSKKTFLASVTVAGSFWAVKGISGVDVQRLCQGEEFESLDIIGEVRLMGGVSAGEAHLGHHLMTGEAEQTYWLKDSKVVLRHSSTFLRLQVQHATVNTSVNRVDLGKLSAFVLRKTCRGWQALSQGATLRALTSHTLVVSRVKTKIVNEQPADVLRGILTLRGGQVISGHFSLGSVHVMGNVATSGLVNRLYMAQFCQVRRPCMVRASKTFSQDLTISGNLIVSAGKTVQGVDLSEELKAVLKKGTCGHVPGLTTFTGGLAIAGLARVHGLVDDVKMTLKHLVTRSDPQTMTGQFIIHAQGIAVIAGSIDASDGLFNKMNLTLLWTNAFREGLVTVVKSPVTFLSAVVMLNASYGTGHQSLNTSLLTSHDWSRIHQDFTSLYHLSVASQCTINNTVHELWGWRSVQRFAGTTKRIVPLRLDWEKGMASCPRYLVVIPRSGDARILTYSPADDHYHDRGIVLAGVCFRKVVGYSARGQDYVVSAHACYHHDAHTNHDAAHDPAHGNQSTSYMPQVSERSQWVTVWRLGPRGARLLHQIPSPGAVDIQVVRLRNEICLVVVEAKGVDTVVVCEHRPNSFHLLQRLPSADPQKVSVVQQYDPSGRRGTFLVVAARGISPQHTSSFFVWRYDAEEAAFSLLQRVSFDNVEWVDLTTHEGDLYLAVVSKGFRGEKYGEVDIYRMDWHSEDGARSQSHHGATSDKMEANAGDSSFLLQQRFVVKGPLEAHFVSIPAGNLYLHVISRDGRVSRFIKKGIHRFQMEGELHFPGKQTMEAWVCGARGRFTYRISLAGNLCSEQDETNEEHAEVLEVNFRP
ncbi:uncharacterized protein [Procambarus clarkii]|uniref:uncharacterized protein n=1 Tax=Procambarus clarkii TaxID=6728 RepID=UPI003744354F